MSALKNAKVSSNTPLHETQDNERTRLLTVAAVAIAEQLGTDVSGIRIVSFKKIS